MNHPHRNNCKQLFGGRKILVITLLLFILGVSMSACGTAVQANILPVTNIARDLAIEAQGVTAEITQPTPAPITWKALNDFLASDHTNWNKYIPGKYTCVNFAMDLVKNAKAKGINAWIVSVEFSPNEPGHAFVGFNTSDKGVVWVEPQTDYAYNQVAVGDPLCLKVNTSECADWGKVTKIISPAQCDPVTSECWQQ